MAKVDGALQDAGMSRAGWRARGVGVDLVASSISGVGASSGFGSEPRASSSASSGVAQQIKPQELAAAQDLFNILLNARQLKNHIANMENLRLIHHKQMGQILEKLVMIERMTEREYSKRIREMELGNNTT